VNNKLSGLLGIARRAGHILIGFDAVRAALLAGKATLVLLAADCSAKTEKELRFAGQNRDCPIIAVAADKAALAAALGLQKPVAAVATDDRGFAAAMLTHVGTHTKEDVAL
jgi:ribosomal protein L7Ae-like RNA K-turn-binding protein